jgi:hypothetical protein
VATGAVSPAPIPGRRWIPVNSQSSGPVLRTIDCKALHDIFTRSYLIPIPFHIAISPHLDPPTTCPRDYDTIRDTTRPHERKPDPPFGHVRHHHRPRKQQPFRCGRSRTGKPCECLKSSKPVRRMKLAHLSTTELVMMSAQTGGIHLFRKSTTCARAHQLFECFLRV